MGGVRYETERTRVTTWKATFPLFSISTVNFIRPPLAEIDAVHFECLYLRQGLPVFHRTASSVKSSSTDSDMVLLISNRST